MANQIKPCGTCEHRDLLIGTSEGLLQIAHVVEKEAPEFWDTSVNLSNLAKKAAEEDTPPHELADIEQKQAYVEDVTPGMISGAQEAAELITKTCTAAEQIDCANRTDSQACPRFMRILAIQPELTEILNSLPKNV